MFPSVPAIPWDGFPPFPFTPYFSRSKFRPLHTITPLYFILASRNLFQSVLRARFSKLECHIDRVIFNRFRVITVLSLGSFSPPPPGNGKLHKRPRAVTSARSLAVRTLVHIRACYWTSSVERYFWSSEQTFIRRNSLATTFVDILCRKSSSFGNSRIVRRERICCAIHRELVASRRRFELSANLHRRGWILRRLLIDDGWSQWNWRDDAWTFLNNYLTYAVFFRLVKCVRRSVELVPFADY